MKSWLMLMFFFISVSNGVNGQDTIRTEEKEISKFAGYHVGVVQILFAHNNGETVFLIERVFIQ